MYTSVFHCLTCVDPFVSSEKKKSVRAFILCIGDFTLQKTLITTFVSFVRVWLKAIVFLHPYGLFLHQLLFCLIISEAFAFCHRTSCWSLLCWLFLMTCSKPSSVSQKAAFPRLDNHPKDVLLLSMWISNLYDGIHYY